MNKPKITLADVLDAINLSIENGCSLDTEIVRIDVNYTENFTKGDIIPKRTLETISIQLSEENLSCIQIERGISFLG